MLSIQNTTISKVSSSGITTAEDFLAVEEPLEIKISFLRNSLRVEKNISITMRTPGNDKELAIGFLFTEGIIHAFDDVENTIQLNNNSVTIVLNEHVFFEETKLDRHFYTSSSCGVCGKSSIEAIYTTGNKQSEDINLCFSSSLLRTLPDKLREHQNVFEQTGGLHASALFNTDGELLFLNEDVGRHNALDKLIGSALMKNSVPLNDCLLLLSGRASFELIQKATMAGISIVAAVGAPSSLAVSLAKERNMTLIGFLKKEKFNIYSGEKRIT